MQLSLSVIKLTPGPVFSEVFKNISILRSTCSVFVAKLGCKWASLVARG